MADITYGVAGGALKKLVDMGDGTHAERVTLGGAGASSVSIDQTTPGTTDSVTVKSQAYSAAVTLTRTADTNAYLANDVIGAATGSTAALTFAWLDKNGNPPPSGSILTIVSSQLEIDVAAIPSGMTGFRLYNYSVTPPSAYGDNVPFDLLSGDRAAFKGCGIIDLGSPVDLGGTLYVEQNGINKQIKLVGVTSFSYLVTIGGFTPGSATVKVITLFAFLA